MSPGGNPPEWHLLGPDWLAWKHVVTEADCADGPIQGECHFCSPGVSLVSPEGQELRVPRCGHHRNRGAGQEEMHVGAKQQMPNPCKKKALEQKGLGLSIPYAAY